MLALSSTGKSHRLPDEVASSRAVSARRGSRCVIDTDMPDGALVLLTSCRGGDAFPSRRPVIATRPGSGGGGIGDRRISARFGDYAVLLCALVSFSGPRSAKRPAEIDGLARHADVATGEVSTMMRPLYFCPKARAVTAKITSAITARRRDLSRPTFRSPSFGQRHVITAGNKSLGYNH